MIPRYRNTTPRTLLGIILTTSLAASLTMVAVPLPSSAETPEERCKRETEAYNQAWQDQWRRTHPKEVEKGIQPPRPNPPYMCFGGPTPSATPSPIPTPPPAPGAADIPGSNPGGGTNPDGSPRPEWTRLKEAPTTIPHSSTSTSHYPYGHDYTHDHGYHYTPVSPTSNTQTSPTQPGRINPGGDNNIPNTGGGTTHHGGQPHYDDPPAPKKRNIIQRLWDKITGNKVEEQHVRDEKTKPSTTSTTGNPYPERSRDWWQWNINESFHLCSVMEDRPVMGYPNGTHQHPDLKGTDLGYQLKVGGKNYSLVGDSFGAPGMPFSNWKGWYLVPAKKDGLPQNNGTPLSGKQIYHDTNYYNPALEEKEQQRRLPAGVIHMKDNNDIVMITPLQSGTGGMEPRGNGELYKMSVDKNGKPKARKLVEMPNMDMSQISGFQREENGKTVTYITTDKFNRTKGVVLWRTESSNVTDYRRWEWYDAEEHKWIKYKDGDKPKALPDTTNAQEMDFRQLPDGTIILMYGQNNRGLRMKVLPAAKKIPQNSLHKMLEPIKPLQEFYDDKEIQKKLKEADKNFIGEALAWSPAFNITPRGSTHQYIPQIVDWEHASLFTLLFTFSQWKQGKPGDADRRYNIAIARLFPLPTPGRASVC